MKYSILALLFCVVSCTKRAPDPGLLPSTVGRIDVLHPEMEQFFAKDTRIEILGEGFSWAEGPVWIESHRMLLFSDVPNNVVYKWTEADRVQPYLQPSGYTGAVSTRKRGGSNGLLLNAEGQLLLCQHGDRRIARMLAAYDTPVPVFETIVSQYRGARFNSPNDAAFHPNGDLFFTDPFYGLQDRELDPEKEIRYQGVYRLKKGLDEPDLIDSTLKCPNGIAFSPDAKTMYVANSDPDAAIWKVYQVMADGTVGNGAVLFDATAMAKSGETGLPDGLKVSRRGVVFATGPGGVLVFNAAGIHLGTIRTGVAAANCALSANEDILFITASNYLLRVKLLAS